MTKSSFFACLLSIPLLIATSEASALCVTAKQANLRTGPGSRYHKTWEVYQYMPLQKIGRKGAWLRVKDVDGDRHWIHRKLVSSKIHCAVVKKSTANIRSGPSTRSRQVSWSPVAHYYSFKTIASKGRWLKVQDEDGDTGWIAKSLLWTQ